ncbi:MAG: radical SAM family heme chaperone HemW [Myxococcota bacterium]|nr:radical SAM family heme chaperone HemW [Myxococcota bacterium]
MSEKRVSQTGIYVHFPYCLSRCPYCDFTVTTAVVEDERYQRAVIDELRLRTAERPIHGAVSLYFGGGTPSLWSPESVAMVVEAARKYAGLTEDAEVTLEVNPERIDRDQLRTLHQAGINRLSVGAQSFSEETLSALGRAHKGEDVERLVANARAVGLEEVSVDLIYGHRDQRLSEALYDLERTISLAPTHLSLYQLTIEDRTVFGSRAARGEQLLVDEAPLILLEESLRRHAEEAGFHFYEQSSAAIRGHEARHNSLYWRFGEYLGLGAGAHGLRHDRRAGYRWANHRKLGRYFNAVERGELPEEERDLLDEEALQEERLLVGLRLREGVRIEEADRARFGEAAARLVNEGLLHDEGGRWRASEQGWPLLDLLWRRLLVD